MSGGPITLSQLREVVEPIMNENFDGVYDQRREWKDIFIEKKGMERTSHVVTFTFGFGNAPILGDGEPVSYDIGGTQYTIFYPYYVVSQGFGITERAIADSDYLDLADTYTRHLAQSMFETEEWLAANVLNFGFNTAYLQQGGDGQPLFSTTHPLAINGTYSNTTTSAALSMTSLENMLIQVRLAVDARGKQINLKPDTLFVPPALSFQAPVVLKSILNPDATSASNAINPINSENSLSGGYKVVTRLTSNTAWFVSTNLNAKGDLGMVKFNRWNLKTDSTVDFNTSSVQYKASMRYIFSWVDPRGMWGNAGA